MKKGKSTTVQRTRSGYVPARHRVKQTPGEMLRTIRVLQEMSQVDLAKASGVAQTAISAIENGRAELGLDRVRKLARALRVHPAVILFSDWEPAEETFHKTG